MSWREQAKFGILSAEHFFIGDGNGALGTDVTSGIETLSDADVLLLLQGIANNGVGVLTAPQILQPDADLGSLSGDNHEFVARGFGNGTSGEFNINVLLSLAGDTDPGPISMQYESPSGTFSTQRRLTRLSAGVDAVTGVPDGSYIPTLGSGWFGQVVLDCPASVTYLESYTHKLSFGETVCGFIQAQGGATTQVSGLPLEGYWASGGIFILTNTGDAGNLDENVTITFDPADNTSRFVGDRQNGTPSGTIHYFQVAKNATGLAVIVQLAAGWTFDGTNSKITFAAGGSLVFIPVDQNQQVLLISSNGGVLAP